MYLTKWIRKTITTAVVALTLAACAKSEMGRTLSTAFQSPSAEEQKVLDQSVFYPGNLAPEVNVLSAVSSGESGTIANPFGGGSKAEGGTIPAPGGSSGGTIPAPGGSSGGTSSGGTSSGGTSGGTASGGTSSGGAASGGVSSSSGGSASSGGAVSGGSDGGTVAGGTTGPSGGSDGGTIPGGPGAGSGGDTGTVNPGTGGSNPGGTTGGSSGGTASNGGTSGGTSGGTPSGGSDGGTTAPGGTTGPGKGGDGGTVAGGTPGTGGSDGGTVNPGGTPGGGSNPGSNPGGSTGGSDPGGPVAGGPTPTPTPGSGGNDGGSSSGTNPGGSSGGNGGGTVAGGPTPAPGGNDGGTVSPGGPPGGGTDGGTNPGNPGGPVAGGPTPVPSPNPGTNPGNPGTPGGNDGGTVGGNPGGTPGGNDGGSTDPCVVASEEGAGLHQDRHDDKGQKGEHHGKGHGEHHGKGHGEHYGKGHEHGDHHGCNHQHGDVKQNKQAKVRVCPVKPEFQIKFSRICSRMRSNIPYPKFVFYEEMRRPVLSMEAQVPVKKSGTMFAMQTLMSPSSHFDHHHNKSSSSKAQLETYLVESRSLAQIDLFEGRWKGKMSYSLDGLKSEYPNAWRDAMLNLYVCDDRDGDGLCGEEGSPWIVSVNRPAFTPKSVPKSVQMDVWHGRFMLLSTDPEYCEKQMSPIVLDLAGNGIKLQGPESGTLFDLKDDGNPVYTGWTASLDDAFLVRDLNGNGRIDSGAELFGSATRLNNGNRAMSGFQALAELDDNNDGLITRKDAIWPKLRLWVDKNRNGLSEKGEIVSLGSMSIESITVGYVDVQEVDSFGNETRMRSTFWRRVHGKSVAQVMVDIWFNTINRLDDTLVSQH